MKLGLHLFTRDGRRHGNALVVDKGEQTEFGQVWILETDFGHFAKLTEKEIESGFYTFDREGSERTSDVRQWRADRAEIRTDTHQALTNPEML